MALKLPRPLTALLFKSATPRLRVGILLVAITLAMSANVVFPLDSIASQDGDYRDAGQMCWNLWFTAESVSHFENPFLTDKVFYPVGANLTTHTMSAAWVPMTLLVKTVTWGSDLYPVYAYKIAIFLSLLFLLVFTYSAIRATGAGFFAALIPACAYSFGDFYAEHIMHLNLLGGFIIPLSAFLLIRLYHRPTALGAMGTSFVMAAGVYMSEFMLFVCLGLGLFLLLAGTWQEARRAIAAKLREIGWKPLLAAVAIFAAVVAPFALTFLASNVGVPEKKWFSSLSANAAGLFVPHPYYTPLYGHLLDSLSARVHVGLGGFESFLGYPFLFAVFIGSFRIRNRYALITLLLGLLFFTLSFGPTLKFFGADTGIPLPYKYLMNVPIFEHNRCPVRLVAVGMCLCAFIAALGIDFLLVTVARPRSKIASASLGLLWLAWTLAETYNPNILPVERVEVPRDLRARLGQGPTLQWPIPTKPGNQMVMQTFHGNPVLNAFLARVSPTQTHLLHQMQLASQQTPERFVAELKRAGYQHVLIFDRVPFFSRRSMLEMPFHVVEAFPRPQHLVAAAGSHLPPGLLEAQVARIEFNSGGASILLPALVLPDEVEVFAEVRTPLILRFIAGNRLVGTVAVAPLAHHEGPWWRFVDLRPVLQGQSMDRVECLAPSPQDPGALIAMFTKF